MTEFRPHIRVQNLSVSSEGYLILKDISVEFPEKSITAIIGPSGCGKTTLLKSICRLLELSDGAKISGKIFIDGVDVYDKKVDCTLIRKKIGYIAQTPNMLPMSIYENVAYGPRVHGVKERGKINEIVERCLRSGGLWGEVKDRLNEPSSKLSVGQQQRLCLSRALAVEPEILLCDEPTSALDPISSKHIEEQLLQLKKEYTIIFVTHILRQAKRLADHVVFLYLGELIECGPAGQVFNQPKNPLTTDYIKGVFG